MTTTRSVSAPQTQSSAHAGRGQGGGDGRRLRAAWSGRRALQARRCGSACGRTGARRNGLRGRVGSYGALRPGCVGPEPWSGVFLGPDVTGLAAWFNDLCSGGTNKLRGRLPRPSVARSSEPEINTERVRLRRSTCRPPAWPGPPDGFSAWPAILGLSYKLSVHLPFLPFPFPVVKVC